MQIESKTLYFGIKKLIQSLTYEPRHFEVRTEEGNFRIHASNKEFWPLIQTAEHKEDFMYIWDKHLKKNAKTF